MEQKVERIDRSTMTPRHLAEWFRSPILWGGVFLLTVIGIVTGFITVVTWIASRASESTSETVVPAVEQPVAVKLQAPPQNVQENVVPSGPRIVDYRGAPWGPVKGGFDPSTIPVEEGLYDGRNAYSSGRGAYAWGILPHLAGLPVAVATARDRTNKNIVLVALSADRYGPYILLSVDGKNSFCKLDLLPVGTIPANGDATMVRVMMSGDEIHLYGLDSRPGLHWWERVEKRSELPCS